MELSVGNKATAMSADIKECDPPLPSHQSKSLEAHREVVLGLSEMSSNRRWKQKLSDNESKRFYEKGACRRLIHIDILFGEIRPEGTETALTYHLLRLREPCSQCSRDLEGQKSERKRLDGLKRA